MSDLDDKMLISNITIPGSHNTGTFACDTVCILNQCQAWDIKNQLEAGIRYLDFRVNGSSPLAIYHGPFRITEIFPMLVHIKEFLEENPSEFLVVSFQLEIGLSDPHKYILQEMNEAGIDAVFSKKIPAVG